MGNNYGTVSNSYATGNVSVTASTYVGGLVGRSIGTISNSYATGSVTTGNALYVGGLMGNNTATGTVSNSYATGSVSGTGRYFGGLMGNNSGAVSNSYATGSVGSTYVSGWIGGLMGVNNTNATISNSYATGSVTGTGANVGGLMGMNYGGIISNDFWNTTTSGRATGIGGAGAVQTGSTGLTTAQMMQFSSFSSWNTATPNTIANTGGSGAVWRIYEGHTAPLLTSFMTGLTLTGAPDATVTYTGAAQSGAAFTLITNVLGAAASGTNAGFYNGYYSAQQGYDLSGGNLTINAAALSAISMTGTRAYDGTANVNANIFTLSGLVGGQTLTLGGVGTVASKNVGAYSVALGSLALGDGTGGGLASNYTFTGGTQTATITQLASVAYTGASGNWSNASNWAGGALPDGANVAAVTIPTGVTVTYDSGVTGTTTLNTLTNSGNFTMAAGTLSLGGTSSMSAFSMSGGTLNVTAGTTTLTNAAISAGTIGLSGTGTLNMAGAWSNAGTFNVAAGTLNLGGTFTTAGLGTFSRTGGTVNLTGVLTNTGNTLDIGSAGLFGTGGLSWLSGSIKNGTVMSGDGIVLNSTSDASSGRLDGVTISGNLTTTGNLYVSNGITLANGAVMNLGSRGLYFDTTGLQSIATLGTSTINSAGGGLVAGLGVAGQTLQINSGVTLQGYGSISQSSAAPVINAGAIIGNTAGQTFTINPTTFTNNGTMSVTAGTMTVSPTTFTNNSSVTAATGTTLNITPGTNFTNNGTVNLGGTTHTIGSTWTNPGTINLNSGILNLGGSFAVADLNNAHYSRTVGSTVNLTGTLTNTGNTLDIGGAGLFGAGGLSWLSGTFKNGTVMSGDGTVLNSTNDASSGRLDGVTISGNLTTTGNLYVSNGITLANGAVMNLGSRGLYFDTTGLQSIATLGTSTINSAGGGLVAGLGVAGQTLQINSGVTLQGYGSISQSSVAPVINAGAIIGNTAGQTFTINPGTFTNNGTLNVTAGTMTINPTTFINNGTINATSGSLNLSASPTGGNVNLASGINLTIAGSAYTVINSLGAAGSVTHADLQGMNGGLALNYALGSNIDASATSAWNAGAGFAPVGIFTGTFDGLGHTVTNLFINRPTTNSVGLFGGAGNGSAIRNVGLVGGSVSGGIHSGGLLGYNYGTVSNSYATGSVIGTTIVGGLVGGNYGTVSNSYATSSVSGSQWVGGLAGRNFFNGAVSINASISNSYATGSVSGSSYVGGLVGYNLVSNGLAGLATVNTSYAAGSVSGGAFTGGLVGCNFGTATVSNSFWDSTVNAVGRAGIGGSGGGGTLTGATGLTTAQMQQQSNFTGWNFANTWVGYDGFTNPLLRSFMTPLTVTANNATKTYDGLAYSGAGGVTYSTTPNANLLGTLSYSGGVNVGSYAIAPSGLYSNQQGYIISYVNGTLTINAAALSAISMTGTRAYDGTVNVNANIFMLSGLVGGQTLTLAGVGTVADKNVGTNKTVTLGSLALGDGTGGGLASNYTFTGGTQTATITAAALGINAATDSKTYDGLTASAGIVTFTGLQTGDSVTGATQSFGSKNVLGANGSTLSATGYTVNDGNGGANYSVTANTATGTITKAALTITANALSKTAGNADPLLTYMTAGLQAPDTTTSTLSGALARLAGETAGLYAINQGTLVSLSTNYTMSYVSADFGITAAPVVVAPPVVVTPPVVVVPPPVVVAPPVVVVPPPVVVVPPPVVVAPPPVVVTPPPPVVVAPPPVVVTPPPPVVVAPPPVVVAPPPAVVVPPPVAVTLVPVVNTLVNSIMVLPPSVPFNPPTPPVIMQTPVAAPVTQALVAAPPVAQATVANAPVDTAAPTGTATAATPVAASPAADPATGAATPADAPPADPKKDAQAVLVAEAVAPVAAPIAAAPMPVCK